MKHYTVVGLSTVYKAGRIKGKLARDIIKKAKTDVDKATKFVKSGPSFQKIISSLSDKKTKKKKNNKS